MTNEERERFSFLLACLFSPPDCEMADLVHQRSLHPFFEHYLQIWGEDSDIFKGFLMEGDRESILRELKEEHHRLFTSETEKRRISLVESFYKPWALDPHCRLSFATEKGLLMGDCALHVLALYKQCGLEVEGEYQGMPDHLAMELEFLSFLYKRATDEEIKRFIEDHLDWIHLLKEEFKKSRAPLFYRSALKVLILFLNREKERLEVERSGEKEIC